MPKPRLLTSKQLAEELGIAPRTVAYYAQHGKLDPALVTPGGQYRWDLEDVHRQLKELRERS